MAKLLFVSKDMGGTKMLVPLAVEARKNNQEVVVVAEGKGAPLWLRAGFEPLFMGTPDFEVIPFELDAEKVFEEVDPDALVIELPGPINLTLPFGLAANLRNVPVVMVEDFWACRKRLPEVNPLLVLTIDEYAARVARESVDSETSVAVIGNHAVIDPAAYKPNPKVAAILEQARKTFDQVFVYVGGGVVEADLRLLVPSLLQTPGNWGLVARYHPKHQNQKHPNGRPYKEVWDELLQPLKNRLISCSEGSSDDVAFLADVCLSAHGSSMSTAAAAGKAVVAIVTPEAMRDLRKSNVPEVPWVELGAATVLNQPQNLVPLIIPPPEKVRQRFQPLNASLGFSAIMEMLKSLQLTSPA